MYTVLYRIGIYFRLGRFSLESMSKIQLLMVDIALNCAIIVKYILPSRLPSNTQSIASRPDIRETTIDLPYQNNSTHRPFQNPSDDRAFFAPTLFSSMRMTCI